MKKFAKLLCLIMALLMLVFSFSACGKSNDEGQSDVSAADTSDLNYIVNKGTMVVGITDFEPMDYKVDGQGEWTGFDAELARIVGEKLGVKVEFQEVEWTKKEVELASKTIDCVWNGLTWDEERAQNMSLSDYYMTNHQVIVVKSANAEKYSTLDALKTATVAAEATSAGEDFITATLPNATYIASEGQKDVLTEILAGTVDAGVIDYIMANYLINKEGSDFSSLKILDGVAEVKDEYYSIAFRKGSDVTAKVNAILAQLKSEGKIEEIAKKYNLENALVK